MVFTKQELDFLKIYNACADTKVDYHDKVEFKIYEDSIAFVQYSLVADLITILPLKRKNQPSSNVFPVQKLTQMLAFCPDNCDINIYKNSIAFGDNAKYQFGNYDFEFVKTDDFVKFVQTSKPDKKYFIKDLDKAYLIREFVSNKDESVSCIMLKNGYFTSSNREDITASIKTVNDPSLTLYLPIIFINILYLLKLTEIEVSEYMNNNERYFLFKIGETFIRFTFPQQKYFMVDVFEDKIRKLYDHKHKVVVNKTDFLNSLQRIRLIAEANIDSRIAFTMKDNDILLENKDTEYSYEKIPAKIDSKINNNYIVLSANILTSISKILQGENLYFQIDSNSTNFTATCIKDDDENILFIHNNYPKYEAQ